VHFHALEVIVIVFHEPIFVTRINTSALLGLPRCHHDPDNATVRRVSISMHPMPRPRYATPLRLVVFDMEETTPLHLKTLQPTVGPKMMPQKVEQC
jgi:hypothetical protein